MIDISRQIICKCGHLVFGENSCSFCGVTAPELPFHRSGQNYEQVNLYQKHWAELHTQTNATKEWLADWVLRIPNSCGCGDSFESLLQRIKPRFDDWFPWTVEIHNAVNAKLGKQEFSLQEATEKWQGR